jgi:hypothetical protein
MSLSGQTRRQGARCGQTSAPDQTFRSDPLPITSAASPSTDTLGACSHVSRVLKETHALREKRKACCAGTQEDLWATSLAASKSSRLEGHAVEGLDDYVVGTIPLRHGLCSTTFGIDFSIIPLGGMSRAHEAVMSRPSWVPDESRSVAVADVFVDGEIEARSSDTID